MKYILFSIFLILSIFTIAQPKIVRSSGTNTVYDTRWGALLNMIVPNYPDTIIANLPQNIGIDSCGAIIRLYDNSLWKRSCNPKRWEEIGGSGGGGISGSGVATQVPFFTDATTLAGDNSFTWNNSTKELSLSNKAYIGAFRTAAPLGGISANTMKLGAIVDGVWRIENAGVGYDIQTGSNAQDLQSVTDNGNTTSNPLRVETDFGTAVISATENFTAIGLLNANTGVNTALVSKDTSSSLELSAGDEDKIFRLSRSNSKLQVYSLDNVTDTTGIDIMGWSRVDSAWVKLPSTIVGGSGLTFQQSLVNGSELDQTNNINANGNYLNFTNVEWDVASAVEDEGYFYQNQIGGNKATLYSYNTIEERNGAGLFIYKDLLDLSSHSTLNIAAADSLILIEALDNPMAIYNHSADTTAFKPLARSRTGGVVEMDYWPSSGGGSGTVTSVSALTLGTTGTDLSSSVANSTTTPVITLNVPTSSASNRGALSSTDWSAFNNKEPAITAPYTTLKYLTGYKTFGSLNDSARAAISLTTTGALPTYNSTTGVLNVSKPIDVYAVWGQSNANGNSGVTTGTPTNPDTTLLLQYDGFNGNVLKALNDPVGNANFTSAWPMFGLIYNKITGRAACIVPVGYNGSSMISAANVSAAGTWDSSSVTTLFDTGMARIARAITALQGLGYAPIVKGVIWVQGHQDAFQLNGTTVTSSIYVTAMQRMLRRTRAVYPQVPFYVSLVGTRTTTTDVGTDSIRQAQSIVINNDSLTFNAWAGETYMATKPGYIAPDGVGAHLSSLGYNDMGRALAEAIASGKKDGFDTDKNYLGGKRIKTYLGYSNLGIGTINPYAPLTVNFSNRDTVNSVLVNALAAIGVTSTDQSNLIDLISSSSTSTHRGIIRGIATGGSLSAPTTVANGRTVFSMGGAAYDGTNLQAPTSISYVVNGTVTTGSVPIDITMNTGTSSGTERIRVLSSGNVGIGVTAPTGALHLKAGTATASSAPLKFTSGTNLTSAEAGAVEYNGTSFFMSPSTTRLRTVLTDNTIPSNGQLPIGNGTNYTNATLTAGINMIVTNASGSITLNADTTAGAAKLATQGDITRGVYNNSGQVTFSGTGIATSFTIAHGLSGVTSGSRVFLTPRTAATAGWTYADLDATNITVYYTVAPANGTNNLKIDFYIIP